MDLRPRPFGSWERVAAALARLISFFHIRSLGVITARKSPPIVVELIMKFPDRSRMGKRLKASHDLLRLHPEPRLQGRCDHRYSF
jgi:hypothetical protein